MRRCFPQWVARSMPDPRTQPVKYAIGNWKMNGRTSSLSEVEEIADAATRLQSVQTLLCLPGPLISLAANSGLPLGGQDCSPEQTGAFTGDQSATLLADVGARAVIVGHSERRTLHGESNATVLAKTEAAWTAGLQAIVCIGETAAERNTGRTLEVLTEQLCGSLPEGVTPNNTIVAYEPVWAIGTGLTASTSDIGTAHAHIRQYMANRFASGALVSLLYGGSLKAANAKAVFSVTDVDGGLVGNASLKASDFIPIMRELDNV